MITTLDIINIKLECYRIAINMIGGPSIATTIGSTEKPREVQVEEQAQKLIKSLNLPE